jgi:hypothetical protein
MIRLALVALALMIAAPANAASDRCKDIAYRERHDPRHVLGYQTKDLIDAGADEFNRTRPWEKQFSAAELWDSIEAYILKACKQRPKNTPIQSIVKDYFKGLAMAEWASQPTSPQPSSQAE